MGDRGSGIGDRGSGSGSGERGAGSGKREAGSWELGTGNWELDDIDLIRRVAERQDEEAFRILYARHTGAVYGLLCRLTGRSSDASDLMQETWLRAVRHLALFRGQSAFRTWLTGIALNCYREWRRRHAREVSPMHAGGRAAPRRAAPNSASDDIAAINGALAGLTSEHREVIVLHDIEGYTHDEIAATLEIEAGTSKSRLSRARRMFRERWRGTR
jgi:RNA polymerase sigma-70 factor, ECF subfamily